MNMACNKSHNNNNNNNIIIIIIIININNNEINDSLLVIVAHFVILSYFDRFDLGFIKLVTCKNCDSFDWWSFGLVLYFLVWAL